MKFFSKISVLMGLASLVSADFHISTFYNDAVSGQSSQQTWTSYVACPSNYYNCDCFVNNDRAGTIVSGNPGTSFFQIEGGLCGMGWLNFYQNGDGSYTFYVDGGDGSVQGSCYWNGNPQQECGIFGGSSTMFGDMTCYSYICN